MIDFRVSFYHNKYQKATIYDVGPQSFAFIPIFPLALFSRSLLPIAYRIFLIPFLLIFI